MAAVVNWNVACVKRALNVRMVPVFAHPVAMALNAEMMGAEEAAANVDRERLA